MRFRGLLQFMVLPALLLVWGAPGARVRAQDSSPSSDETPPVEVTPAAEGDPSAEESTDGEETPPAIPASAPASAAVEDGAGVEGSAGADSGAGDEASSSAAMLELEPGGAPIAESMSIAGAAGDEGAGDEGADDEEATDEEQTTGFSASATVTTQVGQGTFVSNEYARNPYLDWSLDLAPAYQLDEATSFSAQLSVTQELTNSDSATSANQVFLSDMWLTANRKLWTIPVAEIDTSVRGRIYLPTSLASQYEGLYFSGLVQLGLSRKFGDVSVAFASAFRKNFHSHTSPTIDTENLSQTVIFAREGGNELVDAFLVSPGGNNVSYQFRNSLGVTWTPFERFGVGASYLIANGFTYASYEVDGSSGVGAVAGRGQRDAFMANIEATYGIDDRFELAAGILTQGSPRTADNTGFRFPFWDFESEAENLTTVYVALAATLDEAGI